MGSDNARVIKHDFRPPMTVAALMVDYLQQLGVEYVFGVPGGAIEPFYDALADSAERGGPRPVIARHEAGAAFMADGYARETGRLGVCCGTTGPGTTNLVTGVAGANVAHVPLLAISAQSQLSRFGSAAFQESACETVNTVGILQHCTRYSQLISHPAQLEGKFVKAALNALRFPRGAVHLSVPTDIFREPVPPEVVGMDISRLARPRPMWDEMGTERLYQRLREARNPVVVVGAGCWGASYEVAEFAERVDALIVATPQGKGWIDPYNSRFRGVIGFAGHDTANRALVDPQVDLVLVAGADLGEWETCGGAGEVLRSTKVVHVDTVLSNFSRSRGAALHIEGDVAAIFRELLHRFARPKGSRPVDGARGHPFSETHEGLVAEHRQDPDVPERVDPQRLMWTLARVLPEETVFHADTGCSFVWATHDLHPRGVGRCRVEMSFGAMGWAIGSAVGGAMGLRGRPVVCITGDGSLLMNGQEITTALMEELPVIFVVLNDGALGMVRHGQRLRGARDVGNLLPPVDFKAFAEAMGVEAFTVRSLAELERLDFERLGCKRGPTLLDVHIDPEKVPPMGARVESLGT
ncbi:thiamine pyrophosphate-binding protein [Endothiovibrio diazotrophicus]